MQIVFFVIAYLIFAWALGRVLNAALEKLLGDETPPEPRPSANVVMLRPRSTVKRPSSTASKKRIAAP